MRDSLPHIRDEINYLEEKWISELLRGRSYLVGFDHCLEHEFRQKKKQMRSALDRYSDMSGIGETGETVKMAIKTFPISPGI